MKRHNSPHFRPFLSLVICVSVTAMPNSITAATNQYWNAGGTGGDGIWGTSPGDKNWNLAAGAPAGNTVWPDTINDVAVFQDAIGGTVTVFTPVQATGIIQNGANYTINAGTITLVRDSRFNAPFISVQSGELAIDSVLAGTRGLTKTGSGNLNLSGSSTYTGTTAVTAGTLTLTGNLAGVALDIDSGGILVDQSGGLAAGTAVSNAGTLTVNSAETVLSYVQQSGGTLDGSAVLTTTAGATLVGGTVAGSLLGNTTTTGNVLVSGTLAGGSLNVANTGSLTLTGNYTGSNVTINGSLVDANGGLAASATVTNTGTFTVNAADTISTYVQNLGGSLAGTGILTASGGATLNGGRISGNLAADITATGSTQIAGTISGSSLSLKGGTMALSGQSTHELVGIAEHSSLSNFSGGLSASARVTNSGTLDVYSEDTVARYVQTGGGSRLGGDKTLTVTEYALLTNGNVSGKLSGDTTIRGAVVVSGEIGGGTLSIIGGPFSLWGVSTNPLVEISPGAIFNDFKSGLDTGAAIINRGSLGVENFDDSVATYHQESSGSLSGRATLTATNGATLAGGTVWGNLRGDTITTGDVMIWGTIGGGTLSVTAGNLQLNGNSTNGAVNIGEAGSLFARFGALDDAAIVTNEGILNVDYSDTITSYTQNGNGILNGTDTLIVTGGATLNGGIVSGGLMGEITSTGNVMVSGILDGESLSVTGGNLTLSGISFNKSVNISDAASMLVTQGGLASDAALTNAGNLTVTRANSVASYVQNASGRLSGSGTLAALDRATLNGGEIQGTLLGHTVSTGTVLVSGALGNGSLEVAAGTLTLTGIADNGTVDIATAASLRDVNGGLSSQAILSNAGTLRLDAADAVLVYASEGGTLQGAGRLSAETAGLNANSSVTGSLVAKNLITHGTVSISGKAVAVDIRIQDGILRNTGQLGSASTHLEIVSGATLVAAGTQRYQTLTTSGSGAGTWRGDLNNSATTIAPGGENGFGTLQITGDFRNGTGGQLKMQVGSTGHDMLDVGGVARFDGKLSVTNSGQGQIAPFVPVRLFAASDYKSNFTSLEENLAGVVFFNPENGTITRMGNDSGNDNFLSAVTRNQRSTWISLYDDVIDPGKKNVTSDPAVPSGYAITGGIADQRNPDLLQALSASMTPAGLNINLLNHLSAEVYAAVLDYAMQATRQHQRTALSAPALNPRISDDSKSGTSYSSKSSAKDAIPPTPPLAREWEFFAAVDYFHAETDTSSNQANYELSGAGIVAGARNQLSDRFRLAAYVAADDGSINGGLIDSDQSGWSLGLIGETVIDAKTHTILTTAISYGQYVSDGTRESAATTSSGWSPGRVHFSDIDSDSLELYAGLETTVYQDSRFRVIPTAGLRYSSGSMDGFSESTGSAVGSPIALNVRPESYDNWILEMGVVAEAMVSDQFSLQGQLGFNAGLGNESHEIHSSFVKGRRPMSAEAEGLTDNLFYLGLGLDYRVNGDFTIGLGYRSEFRPSHPIEQSCNVSSAFRF